MVSACQKHVKKGVDVLSFPLTTRSNKPDNCSTCGICNLSANNKADNDISTKMTSIRKSTNVK